MFKEPSTEVIRWTNENIVELIRKMRNDLIKDFLDERYLLEYVSSKFNIREIPKVRMELVRNELKDLLIHPVNVSHYEGLIRQIRETDSASIAGGNEGLFYREIESILKRHLY